MMFTVLKDKALAAPLWKHVMATVASFAAFQGTRITLDRFYAASGHPVDYATGQLAFSGEKIFGYYEVMRDAGTFGIYVQTQFFDFAFILSVITFGLCFGTLIARLGTTGSWTRKIALSAGLAAVIGGTLDALENLMSFVLMQFASTIPQMLAVIYSGFAALKFASLTMAMGLAVIALLFGIVSTAQRRLNKA